MNDNRLAWFALTAALAAVLIAWLRPEESAEVPPPTATVDTEIVALRERIERLEERLGAPTMPVATGNGNQRTEVIDWSRIERLIDERLAQHDIRATGAGTDVTTTTPELAAWLAELETAGPDQGATELWAKIRAAGALEEAVAHFERLAEAQPGSPDAQTSLGVALIEQMLAAEDPATRVELGKRIEAQFERALEIDPNHWEGRFRQAIGQSHAPPLSGKRSEAITNFERLVEQQARGPTQAGYEQTYVYLGRLYAEQGNAAKAAETWRLGLARHPGDSGLLQLVNGSTTGR